MTILFDQSSISIKLSQDNCLQFSWDNIHTWYYCINILRKLTHYIKDYTDRVTYSLISKNRCLGSLVSTEIVWMCDPLYSESTFLRCLFCKPHVYVVSRKLKTIFLRQLSWMCDPIHSEPTFLRCWFCRSTCVCSLKTIVSSICYN